MKTRRNGRREQWGLVEELSAESVVALAAMRPLSGTSRPAPGPSKLCSGCSHLVHDPGQCGAWAYFTATHRCFCTFDRGQTYLAKEKKE